MNIELQCCSLFVVLVIYVLFMREKKLNLTNRILFMRSLYSCIAMLLLDIVSVICIYCSTNYGLPPIITKIVCKLYIFSLVLQGYLGYVYVMTELLVNKKYNPIKRILHLTFTFGELLILVLPISFAMDGRQTYSYGASTLVAYALAVIFILSTIILDMIKRNEMPYKKYRTIMTWQGIWLICGIIQFFVPELLLIGFASSFSVIILYTQLENPNVYLDNNTSTFNYTGFNNYVNDQFKYKKQFATFIVKLDYVSQMVEVERKNLARFRVAQMLANLGSDPAFKLDDDLFAVIYSDKYKMKAHLEKFKDSRQDSKEALTNLRYIVIPNCLDFVNPEEFFNFIQMNENIKEETLEVNDELIDELRKFNKIHDLIEDALNEDRVEVFYQPFYNIKTKKFTAAEALVRIRNIDGSIVSPGVFIPVSEETGQIIPLGIRVFELVCQFISAHDLKKLGLHNIEVNLSAAQFDFENPAKFIVETMNKYNIDPSMINLEITETANNRNRDNLIKNVNELLSYGVTFSLDDFGTGRSNFDYLVDLPVQNIKFDYSFTQGYFNNRKIKQVLEGMTHTMHSMALNIVSEGIETREQLEAMLDLNIEYIQGFYFSKPLPKEDFLNFLSQHNTNGET